MLSEASQPIDNLAATTAVVLAGGVGSRLRSVVSDRPKVLASIHNRPFLAYLLDVLEDAARAHLIRGEVVLCTGYMADRVEETFGPAYGRMRVHYSRELTPLGTGGALRAAMPRIKTDSVLVMNGDSFCEVDLHALAAAHQTRRAEATIVLTEVPDTQRFGRVQIDGGGHVLGFEEKGTHSGPGWINAGVYLLDRRLLETIPADRAVSLEKEVFPAWIGRGLYGHPVRGRFLDIGTPQSFAAAEDFFSPLGKQTCGVPCTQGRRRFVALDRDGTIIVERQYLSSPDQVELLPGAAAGLRAMREMGLGLVMVTMVRLGEIHGRLRELLLAQDVELEGIYVCPHTPEDGCDCRKPLPGLLLRAGRELGFDPADALVIGDKPCDIELGRGLGATTILVRTGYGAEYEAAGTVTADHVADDLVDAAEFLRQKLELRT
jgi:histidinol-phosphate phosphatase family protein